MARDSTRTPALLRSAQRAGTVLHMLLLLAACTTTNIYSQQYITEAPPAETTDTGEGIPVVPEGETFEDVDGAPKLTAYPEDMSLDPFATDGNLYWFSVSAEQLVAMNTAYTSAASNGYYYYEVGNADAFADHLVVSDALAGQTADYGKVQVGVVGESTGMVWSDRSIPNLSVDADEFQDGMSVGGLEHLRFNNGMISSIFREDLALRVFNQLDYPAPRTAFAWVGASVWGSDVTVPYTLVESYRKEGWCEEHADRFGGGCANIWEGSGDITTLGTQCQEKACDNTGYDALILTLTANPRDAYTATVDVIDWDMVRQHMCLDWILWIGDDPFHNSNNVVLVEGLDGRFRLLPYSTDISAGQEWYQNTSLYGSGKLASACVRDADCWAQTIATCETTIDAFQALNPAGMVEDSYARLTAQGMLREGDEETYLELLTWYTNRATEGILETELELYREDQAAP